MIFETNKEKGNAGLSMAIAYFGSNGYVVSIPLNDTQDYDLVVEKDDKFYKVQCRATNQLSKYNVYRLDLRSCGGTKGTVYNRIIDTKIDFLFALCGDGTMFLIPKKAIKNSRSINLNKTKSKFDKSESDYSKYIIKF